jgi:hypothetical protein
LRRLALRLFRYRIEANIIDKRGFVRDNAPARAAGRKALKPHPTKQANLVSRHLITRVPLNFAAIPQLEIVKACEQFGMSLDSWRRQESVFGMRPKNPWPADAMRHSYASYWLAVHHDRPRLAELMGNSVETIRQWYRSPVLPSDAVKFWAIGPNCASVSRKGWNTVRAVVELDIQFMQQVVDTLARLQDQPMARSIEGGGPPDDEHFLLPTVNQERRALLRYFLLHETGTIDELLSWMADQVGWNVADADERSKFDKRLRRLLDAGHFNLPIADSNPGPKPKR